MGARARSPSRNHPPLTCVPKGRDPCLNSQADNRSLHPQWGPAQDRTTFMKPEFMRLRRESAAGLWHVRCPSPGLVMPPADPVTGVAWLVPDPGPRDVGDAARGASRGYGAPRAAVLSVGRTGHNFSEVSGAAGCQVQPSQWCWCASWPAVPVTVNRAAVDFIDSDGTMGLVYVLLDSAPRGSRLPPRGSKAHLRQVERCWLRRYKDSHAGRSAVRPQGVRNCGQFDTVTRYRGGLSSRCPPAGGPGCIVPDHA